jgi:hypothetical protein
VLLISSDSDELTAIKEDCSSVNRLLAEEESFEELFERRVAFLRSYQALVCVS